MIKLVKNSFAEKGCAELSLSKQEFAFYDSQEYRNIEGAYLLKVIYDKIDPNDVIVGSDLLCQKIEQTKLHQFKNNVDSMLTSLMRNHTRRLWKTRVHANPFIATP